MSKEALNKGLNESKKCSGREGSNTVHTLSWSAVLELWTRVVGEHSMNQRNLELWNVINRLGLRIHSGQTTVIVGPT